MRRLEADPNRGVNHQLNFEQATGLCGDGTQTAVLARVIVRFIDVAISRN